MSNSLYGDSPANTPEERYEGFRELPMAVNRAQEQVTTVQIRGQAYRVPVDPYGMASKSFYRDLTCLEDEELIHKHGLTPYMVAPPIPMKHAARGSKYTARFKA
ncbi:hypothetical protein TI39_contig283g00008 [Zymoseptoria brevis]|uniref:Uncharacterized protein n=1 Tax=Zymoseptoria brevis TaxID=1047168 RepID=A0A0F4GXB0_9PEZI|nr:hypothetical protein TI39_contig283g00008 [Zymoseptoria brevis]